jgi:UDP-GlcNAc:undecaprenyl-phosphate GlcNAc-1-phosphate transferase
MLATLALNESYSKVNFIAVLSPILILGVPIFDTTLVTFIRIRKGIMPLYGSNDHLAQRVVMLGLTKTQAVMVLLLISMLLSLLAVWSTFLNFSGALLLYLGLGFAAVFAGMAVAGVDMSDYHNILKKRQKTAISRDSSTSKK